MASVGALDNRSMNESLRVLHAASECFPLAKTGGLGDVTGALPSALRKIGAAASVALPAYRGVAAKLGATEVVAEIEVPGARFTVRRGALSALVRSVWWGR